MALLPDHERLHPDKGNLDGKLCKLGSETMSGCIDCVWAVAVLDKDGNQAFFRCTQPKCKNGEYYEEDDDGKESDLYGDDF